VRRHPRRLGRALQRAVPALHRITRHNFQRGCPGSYRS
jgi:hypothetical protein